jgi:hypothetical protein
MFFGFGACLGVFGLFTMCLPPLFPGLLLMGAMVAVRDESGLRACVCAGMAGASAAGKAAWLSPPTNFAATAAAAT